MQSATLRKSELDCLSVASQPNVLSVECDILNTAGFFPHANRRRTLYLLPSQLQCYSSWNVFVKTADFLGHLNATILVY